MENETQPESLIIRFLSGETTAGEDKMVLEWINIHPANRAHFEQLQTAWTLVELQQKISRVDTTAGWASLQQKIKDAATSASAEPVVSKVEDVSIVAGEVASETVYVVPGAEETIPGALADYPLRKHTLYRMIRRTAVAAGLVGIMLLTYVWLQPGPKTREMTRDDQAVLNTLATVLRHEENITRKSRQVSLPDGSTVLLEPNSVIEFEEPFTRGRREITLYGKAEFAVRNDTANPFIVYSDGLSTTALGTRFSVTSFKDWKNIIIHLSEGSVMVQSKSSGTTNLKEVYYLAPGEELLYVKGSSIATIRKLSAVTSKQRTATTQKATDEPLVPYSGEGSWYMFNNQALPQVFQKLEMLYNVEITFSKNDLQNIYFIGRFKQTDSLDKILKEIAEINDLTVNYKDGTFIIEK